MEDKRKKKWKNEKSEKAFITNAESRLKILHSAVDEIRVS